MTRAPYKTSDDDILGSDIALEQLSGNILHSNFWLHSKYHTVIQIHIIIN